VKTVTTTVIKLLEQTDSGNTVQWGPRFVSYRRTCCAASWTCSHADRATVDRDTVGTGCPTLGR